MPGQKMLAVPDVNGNPQYVPAHGSEGGYRYGFNGMEADVEVKGEGNSYTSLWRQYDPRTSRWFSLDPMERSFPTESPYNNNFNNPILLNDPNGDCPPCIAWAIAEGIAWLAASYVAVDAVEEGLDYAATGDKNYDFGIGNSANARQLFKDPPSLRLPQTKTKPLPAPSTHPNNQTKPKPDPTIPPLPVGTEKKSDEPEYIYRGGSNTDKTYTMRGADLLSKKYPVPGLSAATSAKQAAGDKGGKVQKLSVERLRAQGMNVIFDGGGHVTVTTLNENNRKKWAQSREGLKDGLLGQLKAHYITRKVALSRVGEEKVVKTD